MSPLPRPVPSSRRGLRARLAALAATALATGLLAGAAAPAATADAVPASSAVAVGPAGAGYAPGSLDDARNDRARHQLAQALADGYGGAGGRAADGSVRTITYDPTDAPSFQQEIQQAIAIWNQALTGVELVQDTSGWADFRYHEEQQTQDGSFAYTQFDGYGDIVVDISQATATHQELRVVTHETGHILGLPDHYEGGCNELMSGGGAGPDCRNPYPNSQEVAGAEAAMASTGNNTWWWGWGRSAAFAS